MKPYKNTSRDIQTAKRIDTLMNRLFIEPHLGMGYPEEDLPILKGMSKYCKENDIQDLATDFDFWGIQTYTREVVKSAWYIPYLGAMLVKPKHRNVETSVMGWETYSDGIPHFLERFAKYDPDKPLWLSECGMALAEDEDDSKRIDYYKKVIAGMDAVLKKGVRLKGILLWTLVDNFEWAEGYVPKFGIASFNPSTLDRTLKKTAHWLQDYLSNVKL